MLFPVMIIVNTLIFRFLFAPKESFFFVLAAAIVVSWVLMLTLYYVWAIYFYNINLGWTDKDWSDHASKVMADPHATAPEENPNNEETLGLPAGTVRGTIALSVLVGGLAMLIASLAIPGTYSENEFLVDNFEYIKTAFLMVIAFYFGSKSLELIDRKQVLNAPKRSETSSTATSSPSDMPSTVTRMAATPAAVANGDISTGSKAEQKDFDDPNAKG